MPAELHPGQKECHCGAIADCKRRAMMKLNRWSVRLSHNLPPSVQGLHTWREKVDRATKEQLVEYFGGVFDDAGVVVVTHYAGLTVPQMEDLRARMAEVGGTVKVTKNRLVKRALAGTSAESISDLFNGPTAIVFSQDPVAAPKVTAEFAKENKDLVMLGGIMGETVLDAAAVKNLASLPSLDALRGQLVGLLNAPATKVAGVVQAPAGQLARVVGAYAAKGEAA